jgi:hypothetical protein
MLVQLLPDVQKHCLEDMRTAREVIVEGAMPPAIG